MVQRYFHAIRTSLAALAFLTILSPAEARGLKPYPKGEAELAKMLAGRIPGVVADCISLHASEDSQVIARTAIVYREGGTLWVNRPVGGMEQMDDNSILVTRLYTSELCSVDPVRLIDRSSRFERGFLNLGKFIPYIKQR